MSVVGSTKISRSLEPSSSLAGQTEPSCEAEHNLIPKHSSPTMQSGSINVVLFGETGVGKSSIVNLIARERIAKVSSGAIGCTMESTPYNISFDGMNFTIFDTIGLEEPQMGVNGYLKAIEKAFELIKRLEAAGGIHLLLFCMRGGRITATAQSNYRLFDECLCDREVPIALVFTGLEMEVDSEGRWDPESWWRTNHIRVEQHYGIKSRGHVCITAAHEELDKYTWSQEKIRDLIRSCALKSAASLPESHPWFARFARKMIGFITKRLNPGRNKLKKVLMERCNLPSNVAEVIVDMMEKSGLEPNENETNQTGDREAEVRPTTNAGEGITASNGTVETTLHRVNLSNHQGGAQPQLSANGEEGQVGNAEGKCGSNLLIGVAPNGESGATKNIPKHDSNLSNYVKPWFSTNRGNGKGGTGEDVRFLDIGGNDSKITINTTRTTKPDVQISDAALDSHEHSQLESAEALLSSTISMSQNPSYHILSGCSCPAAPGETELSYGAGHALTIRCPSLTTQSDTTNVVLFGETGVGKSSVVNLTAGKDVAAVSSGVDGCTMESTPYNISFDGMNFTIFDTIGLEEPQMGVNGYLKAIEKAFELIKRLEAAGGIHLLLFCMRGGRITATARNNYQMFYERLCNRRVPIGLVVTGLEREADPEDWWRRYGADLEYHGIKSRGHACITAVHDGTPDGLEKYAKSQEKMRDLMKNCALKRAASLPGSHVWFAGFATGMTSFIKRHLHPRRQDLMKVLTQRCDLAPDVAKKIVKMIGKSDPGETTDGGSGQEKGAAGV